MNNFKIIIDSPDSPWPGQYWYRNKTVYVRGHAYLDDDRLVKGQDLANYFAVNDLSVFQERLKMANGFFAVVVVTPYKIYAAVDRMRSIPLFYGVSHNNCLVISDSAEKVRKMMGDQVIDHSAQNEFLQAGFVIGRRTLMESVKQILTGELICFDPKTSKIETKRYYVFLPQCDQDVDESALFKKLDVVYEKTFKRLIKWLDNRQAVIPLSGGYDSRLIILMLREMGYKNVFCFTYNNGGKSWETEISREVAKKLGYSWVCIPYGLRSRRCWFQSQDMKNYQIAAANWCSLPHTQDWPAIKVLKSKGLISYDAAILPGIAAGTVTGAFSGDNHEEDAINYIKNNWMELQSYFFTDKLSIKNSIEILENNSSLHSNSLIEGWKWQEKESKFLTNSVRVYDWFNYSWYLPYCDCEVMDFWESVPSYLRYNKKFHKYYVSILGNSLPQPNKVDSNTHINRIKQIIAKSSRYSALELLDILKNANYNPYGYKKLITGNGAAAITVLNRLKEALREK